MKRAICPSCEKINGVQLLWGMPDAADLTLAEKGEVELGGCVITDMEVDRHCRSCAHQWKSSMFPNNEREGKSDLQKKHSKRNRSKPNLSAISSPTEAISPIAVTHKNQGSVSPKKHPSFIPTVIVFILAWIVASLLAGSLVCGDGWASGSIGRQGACSSHGGVNKLPQTLAFLVSAALAFVFHIRRKG